MNEAPPASWNNALDLLAEWHDTRRPQAGRSALRFLETELRLMTPAIVRRSWPDDLVEEALRAFLVRLIQCRLPDGITDPRAYLRRAFRNHCIDSHRVRARRPETSLDALDSEWEDPDQQERPQLNAMQLEERRTQVHSALARLSPTDRVVLKLDFAPEWLTDEEITWLARRTDSTPSGVRAAVDAADDMHALTRIFDPGTDDPDDPEARRMRMERFRRRRARAREKLRPLLEEEEEA